MPTTPLFWLFAFVLSAGTLAALVLPLLRRHGGTLAPGDEAAATAVFRDHKRQVDADHAAGALTDAERDTAQAELLARFGAELDTLSAGGPDAGAPRPRRIVAFALVLLLPAAAVLLYVVLGNQTAIIEQEAAAPNPVVTDPKIVAMVEKLADRMKASPEDGNGWTLLARSYMRMGRFKDSAAAFAEAAPRLPPDAGLLADWADVLAQTQGGRLAGRPIELVNQALQLDPDHLKSLALLATAAQESGDRPAAIAAYRKMRAQFPAGSQEAKELDDVLAELGAPPEPAAAPRAAGALPANSPANPPANPPAMAAPAAPAAAAPAVAAAGSGIVGRVELDPKLKSQVAAGDVLFVFARNPTGSRMPLAILRVPAEGDWPRAFTLTDAMAMQPGATISAAKSVVVEARISKAGSAMPQPGDLSGTSAEIAAGARNVRVVIDKVLP
jgi:cytochrome c-type biogenesis protein CcmH